MQLDGKTVGWGTTIALLSLSRKKEVRKYVVLGEDGAFKEKTPDWSKQGGRTISEETEEKF